MSSINNFISLFSEVWQKGIFGINATEIIIGFAIFLAFYVLRRLFARFIIGRLNKIVLKSKTTIDDTVVEVIEGPLKFLPVVIGFFIASSYIDLKSDIQIKYKECSIGSYPYFNFLSKTGGVNISISSWTMDSLDDVEK